MVKCERLEYEKYEIDITGSQMDVVNEMIYLIFKFADIDSPIKGDKDLIKGCIYALCMGACDMVEEKYGEKDSSRS